jgi:hypothetical protein
MDWIKVACIALVVGVIGPLFWLGVDVFQNWVYGLLRRVRQKAQRRRTHSRLFK